MSLTTAAAMVGVSPTAALAQVAVSWNARSVLQGGALQVLVTAPTWHFGVLCKTSTFARDPTKRWSAALQHPETVRSFFSFLAASAGRHQAGLAAAARLARRHSAVCVARPGTAAQVSGGE